MEETLNPGAAWGEDDSRLLDRLRDEQALDALFVLLAPSGAAKLPRRAAVLVRQARRLQGGDEAARSARAGSPGRLAELLSPARLTDFSPELLHASAIFFERVGNAHLPLAFSETNARAAQDALTRGLAAWLVLEHEPTYLRLLARAIVGEALEASELDREVVGIARARTNALAREAALGAKSCAPAAGVALRVLARIGDACRLAGLEATVSNRVVDRAERLRARVIDDVLGVLGDALDDARGRGAALDEGPQLLARVHEVWLFTDRDVAVERFACERIVPISWDAHVDRDWAKLRRLLAPCLPLFDSLEARLLSRPLDNLAYSAHIAQTFVFRSEAEEHGHEIPLLERGVRVCPSHRNARSVLAHYLCERALRVLARSNLFTVRSDALEAARLIERAQQVFADSPRIAEASAALTEAKKRFGVFVQ